MWFLYLGMLGKGLQLKSTTLLTFFQWLSVRKTFANHLENYDFYSDFKYGFRSSRSMVDLLIALSDRIARDYDRPGSTRAATVDIYKAFARVWRVFLCLPSPQTYVVSVQEFQVKYLVLFHLILSIDGFE